MRKIFDLKNKNILFSDLFLKKTFVTTMERMEEFDSFLSKYEDIYICEG